MPIRIAHQTVRIRRGDQNVTAPIGVPFEFTDEEVDHFRRVAPHALRRAIVEKLGVATEVTSAASEDADPVKVVETPKPETKPAAKRGKGTVTTSSSDEDEL